jgi:hypothetical protein
LRTQRPGGFNQGLLKEMLYLKLSLLMMIVMWERAMWERIIVSVKTEIDVEAKKKRLSKVLQDKMRFQDEARAAAQRYCKGDLSKCGVSGLLDA